MSASKTNKHQRWHELYWDRSSHPEVILNETVLRNFAKFTGKHMHAVGRGFLTHYFMKTPPYIVSPPFFQICFQPSLTHSPAVFLASFFGWMCDRATSNVLFYLMISRSYAFYATRRQVYCSFNTYDMAFASALIWYHTHRQIHTQHIQGPIDWH